MSGCLVMSELDKKLKSLHFSFFLAQTQEL